MEESKVTVIVETNTIMKLHSLQEQPGIHVVA